MLGTEICPTEFSNFIRVRLSVDECKWCNVSFRKYFVNLNFFIVCASLVYSQPEGQNTNDNIRGSLLYDINIPLEINDDNYYVLKSLNL